MSLLSRLGDNRRTLALECCSLLYNLLTSITILSLFPLMDHPGRMLLEHLGIAILTVILAMVHLRWRNKWTNFLRIAFQLYLLSYWYPETFEFNRLLPNLDHFFASWEQALFNCQPSLLFSENLPQFFWSEAFHMGYVAYFPMIFLVVVCYFFLRYREFEKVTFVLLASFFIYYLIYIILPVAGPQYYFPAIGWDMASSGVFPNIEDYFNLHWELPQGPGHTDGLFCSLVESAHSAGERPTAAFPSSHVGISTIIMMLSWRLSKRLTAILTPFYVLLCLSTVYIHAHYLIDSIAGLLSAPIICGLSFWLYRELFENTGSQQEVA